MGGRPGLLIAVLTLIASTACSNDVSAVLISSPDGLLTIEIPAGVQPSAAISARALSGEELPAELRSLDLRGAVHELEPDGLTFERPVTIKRYLDPEALGFDPANEIRQVTLVSRSSNGEWSVLEDQRLSVEGERGVVTATTTHFSTVAAFAGAVVFSMEPDDVSTDVGKKWSSCVSQRTQSEGSAEYEDVEGWAADSGVVRSLGVGLECEASGGRKFESRPVASFECASRGSDRFGMRFIAVESARLLEDLLRIELGRIRHHVTFEGTATCRDATASKPDGGVSLATALLDPQDQDEATRISTLLLESTGGGVKIIVPKQWTPEPGSEDEAIFSLTGGVKLPGGRAGTLDCAVFGSRRNCLVYPTNDPGKTVASAPLLDVSINPGGDWSMTVPLVEEAGRSVAVLGADRFQVEFGELRIVNARPPLLIANLDGTDFDSVWD